MIKSSVVLCFLFVGCQTFLKEEPVIEKVIEEMISEEVSYALPKSNSPK